MPNTPATWLDAVTVNATTTETRSDPRVTVLSNGNILISWTAVTERPGDLPLSVIVGQMLDPLGNPVNGEFEIHAGLRSSNGDIRATADGGFLVVLEREESGYEDVLITRFDASGASAGTASLFIDNSGAVDPVRDPSGFDPAIAVASATSGLTIWRETTETGASVIRGYVFNPSSPISQTQINQNRFDLTTASGIQGEPAVVALANGQYVVAVAGEINGDSQIRFHLVNQAGVVQSPIPSNGAAGVEDRSPSLTALPTGGFVMAWVSGATVVTQRFRDNLTLVGEQTILSGVSVSADNAPTVHVLANGQWAVAFIDAQSGNLLVQRIDGNGDPRGDPAVIDAAGGDVSSPGLSLLPDGRLVVTFIDAAGQVAMEILDTRDAVSGAGTMFTGTAGNDELNYAGPGAYVGAGAGDDFINTRPTTSPSTYDGGDGDDWVTVGAPIDSDILLGGRGVDLIDWSDADEFSLTIDMVAGTATDRDGNTEIMLGFENVTGTPEDDVIIGDAGDNVLRGIEGVDQIDGGGGNDTLNGGQGNDTLNGGSGLDTADYSGAASAVTARIDAQAAFNDGDGGTDTFISIENLTGSAFDDLLIGNGAANVLSGGLGRDTLLGFGGDDVLIGGAGVANTLQGGAGNDTYVLDAADSVVESAGEGTDLVQLRGLHAYNLGANVENGMVIGTGDFSFNGNSLDNVLTGGSGNDILQGAGGNDTLNGGAGIDTVTYILATAGVTARLDVQRGINDGHGAQDIFTGIENLTGSNLGDLLIGNAGNNVLDGAIGNDTLLGFDGDDILIGGSGGGNNQMQGGKGDDTYIVTAADTLVELAGEGIDTILTSNGGLTMAANIEILTFTGSGNFGGTGNAGDNVITGGAGHDTLSGMGGNDTLIGGDGIDLALLRGVQANYTITAVDGGWQVVDSVAGRDGTDLLLGVERIRFSDGTVLVLGPAPVAVAAAAAAPAEVMPLLSDKMAETDAFVLPALSDKGGDAPLVLPALTDGPWIGGDDLADVGAFAFLTNPYGDHALRDPGPDVAGASHGPSHDWLW